MKIAFQIDYIKSLKPKTDSTLIIMKEAVKRGFDVWFYYPNSLSYEEGSVRAKIFKFNGAQQEDGLPIKVDLDSFNFIFLRQDPPFNMNYITTTYLLEKLKKAKVLNNPTSVRNAPEKIFVLDFAQFMPKTIISSNFEEIKEFWNQNDEIILKPLFAHGGMGVFYIPKDDKNLFNTFRMLGTVYNNEPIIAQSYIKNVTKGDKRILFVDGEVVGALNRVQAINSAISNTAVGSKYEKTTLTTKEEQMALILGPVFKKQGLFLVGIDVIDEYITEINVTSPTGFALVNELYETKTEEKIIEKMLLL